MTQEANLSGNPLIPTHPEIAAQHAAAGAPPAQAPQPNGNGAPKAPQTPADINWSEMFGFEGDDPQAATPPAAPQVNTPAPATAPPQPQELTPEQKIELARTAEEGGQPPQTPATQPTDPQQAINQAVNHLLSTTYKLSPEQKKQLIAEPDVAIPQLAASMHVTIATQLAGYMQQMVQNVVPQMAIQAMQKQMGAFRAEQAFFGKYPSLSNPAFKPVIMQCIKYAKSLNPGATRDKVMQEAAEMAAFKLKVQLTPQAQPQAAPPQPRAQAPTLPFTPAAAGGTGAPPQQPQQEQNPWAALADDPSWS